MVEASSVVKQWDETAQKEEDEKTAKLEEGKI